MAKNQEKYIYGYVFAIVVERGETGYIASCPWIGGVYEEGETKEEAIRNAYDGAVAILNCRQQQGDLLIKDNPPYLRVLRKPPTISTLEKATVGIGITKKTHRKTSAVESQQFIATLPPIPA